MMRIISALSRHCVATVLLLACARSSHALNVYGVADEVVGNAFSQSMVRWDSSDPNAILSSAPITGLLANDKIVAMDFDFAYYPGYQQIYAFAVGNRDHEFNVYLVDPATAAASLLPSDDRFPNHALGDFFGVEKIIPEFNIYDDAGYRYRGFSGENETGIAGFPAYVAGDVNFGKTPHIAHFMTDYSSKNIPGAASFGFDTDADVIVRVHGDILLTTAPLGADYDGLGGIDVHHATGQAFAALQPAGQNASVFYSFDVKTATITPIGPIGGKLISAMAIEPVLGVIPEPASLSLAIIGAAIAMRRQRGRAPQGLCKAG
jgi:hypothetical protein